MKIQNFIENTNTQSVINNDPIMQIAQMAGIALQNKDCEAAMAACEAFLKLLQQASEALNNNRNEKSKSPVFKKGSKLKKLN